MLSTHKYSIPQRTAGATRALVCAAAVALTLAGCTSPQAERSSPAADTTASRPGTTDTVTRSQKADGYRGIWYMNQPLDNEYRFKYSGGLATYTAKHRPFAVYSEDARKTFFCYGGTTKGFNQNLDLSSSALADTSGGLLHMVSYYDHATGTVARPTVLLDKETWDAHDNPVITLDDEGFVWIFSTSHGRSRPSYIHRSVKPHSIDRFERIHATREQGDRQVAIDNFSYAQPWYVSGRGFVTFFTRYDDPVDRTPVYMTSPDGVRWSAWQRIAAIGAGHYQISATTAEKAATALNYHPENRGVNWRTNLYYLETENFGDSWQAVDGTPLELPLTQVENDALVHDYAAEGLLVYLKDIRFDEDGRPVILFITSPGYASGPENSPRTWRTAYWTGTRWRIRPVTTSDNNYDMGSLYLENDGRWRVIAPTDAGPQPFNPGGEVAMWLSDDRGDTWRKAGRLTDGSPRNHTYVRRPVNADRAFYAFWADGHGRQPSISHLYFATRSGEVLRLPPQITDSSGTPEPVR